MSKIKARIYSCNKFTYSPISFEIARMAMLKIGKIINKSDFEIEIKDLSENGSKTIQQQKYPAGEHSRTIEIYEDEKIQFVIGLSNTNYDEDMRIERLKIDRKKTYGEKIYHANTYFLQGINKIFDKYLYLKKENPHIQLYFFLLDIHESYPHNKFNLHSYRMLSTIGFFILNISNVRFSEYRKFGYIPDSGYNIEYKSFNKFMNDKIAISKSNRGNIPAYLKCIEVPISDYDQTYRVEKYIYTFKALGAGAYDSFITMWTLNVLASLESKKIEFLISIEKYNFKQGKENQKQTTGLPKPLLSLLNQTGIRPTIQTSQEILQHQRAVLEGGYSIALKSGEIRNQELFRNNLRQKAIQMKCCLCDCEVEDLLDAAHLWGIKEIKEENGNSLNKFIESTSLKELFQNHTDNSILFKKYILANSGDNGIWLCKNHHGAFDRNYFSFNYKDGSLLFLKNDSKTFEQIVKELAIYETFLSKEVLNKHTSTFLMKRNQIFINKIVII
jgi:hypothetical protein